MSVLRIKVNGEAKEVAVGTTVSALLHSLGYEAGLPVAVERNRRVVPRAQHAQERLADGDKVEVVTFVGGG